MNNNQRVSLSMERRIILVFIASALGGILLVGGSLWFFLQRAALAQNRTYLESQASTLARQCENEIATARQDLEFIAKLPAFKRLSSVDRIDLAINGVPENVEVEKRQLMAQLMDKSEQFSLLFILRPNADKYLQHPFRTQLALKEYNLANRPYYQEAVRTKKTTMSDSFLGAGGKPGVAILVPILAESGEVTSYLGGFFYLSSLSQLVSIELIKPFDAGFIVDRKGQLIAHTDTAMLREGVREHFIEQRPLLFRFLASANSTVRSGRQAVHGDEIVSPMNEKRNLRVLVSLSSGWCLGLMRDRATILAEVRPVIWGITSMAGLLLALVGGLGVAFAHGIGRRWDNAERGLRSSEARYRSYVDVTEQIAWVTNAAGEIVEDVPSFRRFTGQTCEEARGTGWAKALHPDDIDSTLKVWQNSVTAISPYETEYRMRRHDGVYRDLLARGFPVLSEDGSIREWVGTCIDITERKMAEEEIHTLNAELEQRVRVRTAQLETANKELEAFSYSVSHDLRAPLRHVQGYVDMLAREVEGQLSDKSRHYMKTIEDASQEMGVLIDDLLAFSRMGRAEMCETSVDLDKLVQETLRDLETATRNRNINWNIQSLPSVQADPAMLKLALANLLGNAVKFTRPRNPAEIEIGSSGMEGERVIVFVRDNGVGFDPQYTHKLFGVFQRLHRADEFEGTGIGLANVRRIIARHGGGTWAEGKLNEGATFFFTLKPSSITNPTI